MSYRTLSSPTVLSTPTPKEKASENILRSIWHVASETAHSVKNALRRVATPAAIAITLLQNSGCADGKNCSAEDTTDCEGAILGLTELVCNPGAKDVCDNVDNDCDGETDEDVTAKRDCTVNYYGNNEACLDGEERCTWIPDQPGVMGIVCEPKKKEMEICDGKDNDCNELTDDNVWELDTFCPMVSTTVCDYGKVVDCDNNGKIVCQDLTAKDMIEECDLIDNNCNGQIDETFTGILQNCQHPEKKGVCGEGSFQCFFGEVSCVPWNPTPTFETCDGKDNDCDGLTDENIGIQGCFTGLSGVCLLGEQQCFGEQGYGECIPKIPPTAENQSAENCDDGKDNDCDGLTDETDVDSNCAQ